MPEEKNYNGWKNYATWRVRLEIVDPVHYQESGIVYDTMSDLADAVKENVESFLSDEAGGYAEGFNHDYAMAFISEVNWYEIAESIAGDYPSVIKK